MATSKHTATSGDLVWFKNKFTGFVAAAHKGSEAFKRMSREMTAGDEPELIWQKTKAPTVKRPVKYGSPEVATFVAGETAAEEPKPAKTPAGGDGGSGDSGSGDGGK